MVIFRAINASWPRRMQFAALAGLASVSILAGGMKSLRAEWFASKKATVSAEPNEPRANDGFDKAIRNLLKEANRHEKKGELVQAINLAERAAKIAEESSSLVKIPPDISSSAISDYVKELRIKKQTAELSLKRAKSRTSNETAIASSSSKESSAKDKSARPSGVKSPVVTEPLTSHALSDGKSGRAFASSSNSASSPSRTKARPDETSPITTRTASRSASDSEPVDFPSPSERSAEPIATKSKATRPSKTVASNEEPPFEPFVEDEPRQKHVPQDIRSSPKIAATSNEVIQSDSADATRDSDDLTLISSTSIDELESTNTNSSQVVKLRYRYRDRDQNIEHLPTVSINSTSRVGTFEATSDVTTAASETDGTSREQEIQPLADRLDDEFPVIQVRDLRQATDASSSPDPREPETEPTNSKDESAEPGEEHQFAPSKTLSPFRIRRTLKLRNTYSVLPLLTPVVARTTREPVVGRTSIIHWRPAKEASPTTTDDFIRNNDLKTGTAKVDIRRTQSDNDKSFIDHASTGIRHNSARHSEIQKAVEFIGESPAADSVRQSEESRSVARREIRGSLWDNAAVPTYEGTWRPATPQTENPRKAPLPPRANPIEQTAFTRTQHGVQKYLRSEMNRDSIEASEYDSDSSPESTAATADFVVKTEAETPDESESWDDDLQTADAIVNNDLVQQTTGQTGLPESTVSTMLGAFGVVLLIAGIWMVRATAGIKHD
ncbi:MAG: hypothetical protein WCH39_26480 [Schlesneria sp.]